MSLKEELEELRKVTAAQHVWLGMLYGGTTLIAIGTGAWCTAFGSMLVLHALIITWSIHMKRPPKPRIRL